MSTYPFTASAVLATAAKYVGKVGGGTYWKALKPEWAGAPYCAAFVEFCLREHGGKFGAPLPFYVPSIEAEARKRGLWIAKTGTPRPGDLVIYGYDRAQHVGFVERVLADGMIQTIEGNTSSGNGGSQANGNGTYRRVRSRAWVRGFVRMDYKRATAKPKPKPKPGLPAFPGVSRPSSRVNGATRAVQARLRARGWKIGVDGKHGPETTRVIKAFQKSKGLQVDGIAGPKTWAALWRLPIT